MFRAGVFKKGPLYTWTCRWTNGVGKAGTLGYHLTRTPEGEMALRLTYAITNCMSGEKKELNYTVELTTTRPHFGGQRFWFRCPMVTNGVPCRKRVAKLYLPSGGRYFGCRICYDLTYRSAQEHDKRGDMFQRLLADELLGAGKR
jgi:hypothetical protein